MSDDQSAGLEPDCVARVAETLYPFVLGSAERLFGETSDKKPLRPVDTRTVGDSLVLLTYQRLRDA
jgi:hypothetical protein